MLLQLEFIRANVAASIYGMINTDHDMPQRGYKLFIDNLQNNLYRAVWQNKERGVCLLVTVMDITQPEAPAIVEIMQKA